MLAFRLTFGERPCVPLIPLPVHCKTPVCGKIEAAGSCIDKCKDSLRVCAELLTKACSKLTCEVALEVDTGWRKSLHLKVCVFSSFLPRMSSIELSAVFEKLEA